MMMLDVIAFTVHLKMKYHSDLGNPIVVTIKARLIHETILKNSLETIVASEKIRTKAHEAINVLNLDVRGTKSYNTKSIEHQQGAR